MRKFTVVLWFLLMFLSISVEKGYTNITEPGDIGAIGGGMASVVANPDDVIASFYYNPAGLARLEGTHVSSGADILEQHIVTARVHCSCKIRCSSLKLCIPLTSLQSLNCRIRRYRLALTCSSVFWP